jgi:hypothetical protein
MIENRTLLFWRLAKMLRVHYGRIAEEPLPDRWVELIHALNERDRSLRQHRARDKDA